MFLIQRGPPGWKTTCPVHKGSIKVRKRVTRDVLNNGGAKGLLLHRSACALRYTGYRAEWPCFISLCRGVNRQGRNRQWETRLLSIRTKGCLPVSFAPELAYTCLSWARTLEQSPGEVHRAMCDLLQTKFTFIFKSFEAQGQIQR